MCLYLNYTAYTVREAFWSICTSIRISHFPKMKVACNRSKLFFTLKEGKQVVLVFDK